MNERITENFVRDHFKLDPLFASIKLEEQKSYSKQVTELLQGASKSGKGIGKPEFIVSFPAGNMDYLLVIECKASAAQHRSKQLDSPKDYAVDGVLHYACKLSAQFDVVAIAVSGQTQQELQVSNFVWRQGSSVYQELENDQKLLSINDYIRHFTNEQFADNLKAVDIVKKAIYLNDWYQAYSVTEMTRCTMVSAILLALINDKFRASYALSGSAKELGDDILNAIKHELKKHSVKSQSAMIGEYQKILNEPLFTQDSIKHNKRKDPEASAQVAKEMVQYLAQNVYPLTQMEQNGFDVLGRFYTEFIRYAGSEQSQGLVLTPFHITDLFCELVGLNENSVVYDPCTGTGGFLIAAMKRMFQKAGANSNQIEHIKNHQLVGVELRPSMFTYACSNMMLRGDGKSNIYCGSCFELQEEIKNFHKPNIAFLNPPYDVGTTGQMKFIEHALNVVASQNGIVAAIVQMSCAIKNEKELIATKERLLQKHHLKAVLSMPDDLFYPVGVVTCVMVFQSNKPNKGLKTWFGYFKNDGFEKRKHRGRGDYGGVWKNIKKHWTDAYQNKDEVLGLSVKYTVTAQDEWLSEAYLDTDYQTLSSENFVKKIKDFLANQLLRREAFAVVPNAHTFNDLNINQKKWLSFKYKDIFEIKNGYYNKKPDSAIDGDIIFIGATENNNGITSTHHLSDIEESSKDGSDRNHELENKIYTQNCITVSNNGSVGCAFYQNSKFTCSHDVNVLYLKQKNTLNSFIAFFLVTLIEQEKYRWAYGRKWRPARMPESIIKLPVKVDESPDWQWMEDYIKSLPYSANL